MKLKYLIITKDEGSSALPVWQDASTQALKTYSEISFRHNAVEKQIQIVKSVSDTMQLKSKYKGNVGAYTMSYQLIIVHVT